MTSDEDKGMHLLLDCDGCDKDRLEDKNLVTLFLQELPNIAGMRKISKVYLLEYPAEKEDDSGITGFVILAESHVSIHTYPKRGKAFIDVFACCHYDKDRVIDYAKNTFLPETVTLKLVYRGLNIKK